MIPASSAATQSSATTTWAGLLGSFLHHDKFSFQPHFRFINPKPAAAGEGAHRCASPPEMWKGQLPHYTDHIFKVMHDIYFR